MSIATSDDCGSAFLGLRKEDEAEDRKVHRLVCVKALTVNENRALLGLSSELPVGHWHAATISI